MDFMDPPTRHLGNWLFTQWPHGHELGRLDLGCFKLQSVLSQRLSIDGLGDPANKLYVLPHSDCGTLERLRLDRR